MICQEKKVLTNGAGRFIVDSMRATPKENSFIGADISRDLWQRFKLATIREGKTIKVAISEALESWLKRRGSK